MVKLIASYILVLFCLVKGKAQPLTLKSASEAINYALEHSAEVKVEALRFKQAEIFGKTAYNIDKTRFFYSFDENNIASNEYPIYVIGLSQSFLFPTIYAKQRRVLDQESLMAEAQFDRVKRQTARMAAMAFEKCQYQYRRLKWLEKSDSLYSHVLLAAEARVRASESSEIERLSIKNIRSRCGLQLNEAITELEATKRELKQILQIETDFEVKIIEAEKVIWKADTLQEPGAAYYKAALERSRQLAKLEGHKMLPDFEISWFGGTNQQTDARWLNGIQFGIGIPIWFVEQKARKQAALLQLEQTGIEENAYKLAYDVKALNLQTRLTSYLRRLNQYESEGIILKKSLFSMASLALKTGEIDILRLLPIYQQALDLEHQYAQDLFEYNSLVYELIFFTL